MRTSAGVRLLARGPALGEYMFAGAAGQMSVSSQAARACLRGMLKKAGIEKKISRYELRHTYTTNLLDAGIELVDIHALPGHSMIDTTQIYINVGRGADGTPKRLVDLQIGLHRYSD